LTEILSIDVTFGLPDWVEKYDYDKKHYDSDNSYSHDTMENEVFDYLWEKMHWEEASLHYMAYWVKFILEYDTVDEILPAIAKLQQELIEILEGHFRSGKRKPHGNVY
jgi:hypothetical protein